MLIDYFGKWLYPRLQPSQYEPELKSLPLPSGLACSLATAMLLGGAVSK